VDVAVTDGASRHPHFDLTHLGWIKVKLFNDQWLIKSITNGSFHDISFSAALFIPRLKS
jgi:hypothetical protein